LKYFRLFTEDLVPRKSVKRVEENTLSYDLNTRFTDRFFSENITSFTSSANQYSVYDREYKIPNVFNSVRLLLWLNISGRMRAGYGFLIRAQCYGHSTRHVQREKRYFAV